MSNLNQIYSALTRTIGPISNGPIGRRSSAEAQLRYLPALQALMLLAQQNNTAYHQGVQGVKRGGYAAAQGIGGIRTGLLQQLSDTPAPTSEAAAHLGLTRDAVSGELAKMQANQIGGVTSNTNQLRVKHNQDIADVVRQLFQTAQQGSLYNTTQYEALASDARKAKQQAQQFNRQQATSLRKSGLDAQGNPIPGIFNRVHPGRAPRQPHAPVDGVDYQTWLGMSPDQRKQVYKSWQAAGRTPGNSPSTLPGGAKPLSQSEHNSFRRQVLDAQHWVNIFRQADKGPGSRHKIATALLTGGKSTSGTTVPSFDQDVLTVALDLSFLNGVSRTNRRMLNSLGYSVKTLGFPTYSPTGGVIQHQRRPSSQPSGGDPTGRFG